MNSKKKSETGLIARETLDAGVAHTAQGKLDSCGCDPAVHCVANGLTRFVIRVEGGEIRIQSRLEFLPTLQVINSSTAA